MLAIHLGYCSHACPYVIIDRWVSFPIGEGVAPLKGISVYSVPTLESQLIPVLLPRASNLVTRPALIVTLMVLVGEPKF